MKFRSLLFDLDGTLVDSAPDLTAALNHVLEDAGRPGVSLEQVRHMVGFGGRKLIQHGFAFTGTALDDDAERLERLFDLFIRYYERNIAVKTRLFPGVAETLRALHADGARFAICTNKPERLSVELIDHLGLADLFPVVLGADSLENNKPHPDHLRLALKKLEGHLDTAVMIGDSATDVSAAHAAGMPVIAVSFGYSATPAEELEADALIDDFADLPAALSRLS